MKRSSKQIKAMLLIGPTGAGKTPLGDHIEINGFKGERCFHFDFGDQLRRLADRASPPEGVEADEHTFIRDVLEKGQLLENEHFIIAEKIIGLFLEQKGFAENDILVLNGLPRHIGQAEDIGQRVKVLSLLVLECSAEDVLSRIRQNTGSDRTGRSDDGIEMVQKKIEIFKDRTSRLIAHYSNTGSTVLKIKVGPSSTAGQMYSELMSLSEGLLL